MISAVDQADLRVDLRTEHRDDEADIDAVFLHLAQRVFTGSPPAKHRDEHQDTPSAYRVIDATAARALASAWARGPLRLDKPGTRTSSSPSRAGGAAQRALDAHPQDPAVTEVLGPVALTTASRRMQRLRARLAPSAARTPSAPIDRFACDLALAAPSSIALDVKAPAGIDIDTDTAQAARPTAPRPT